MELTTGLTQKEYNRRYYLENKDRIKENVEKWQSGNWEKVKDYKREWRKKNPKKVCEIQKRWSENNPEKMRSKYKYRTAVKNGTLVRPVVCSECEEEARIEGHHEDYDKPLDVIWVCNKCHNKLHGRVK